MSIETRSGSALFKRAEQLKRWEESETNRDASGPRQRRPARVKFSSGCVFLAACAAGDKDEVLRLLEMGADVDTANVDGLTALHQACIDDNLDMVEFLVDQGADVNRGDNEGWTPLHATASCGFLYIARYLIDKGADVAAVNNDGELPLDITEYQKMGDLLRDEIAKRGIDCAAARNFEEISMMRDAKEWLTQKNSPINVPHPKTGATALHVAAAKGYSDVMKVLLQCGADIDAQDVDGWTPMHAAAHWGQKGTCQMLAEHLADMDAKNYVGQTAFDLCDSEMLPLLDDLKKKQNKEDVNKRKAIKRLEPEDRPKEDTMPKIPKKVEVEIAETKNDDNIGMEVSSESESETESETESSSDSSSDSELEPTKDEIKNQVNASLSINDVAQKDSEGSKPPVPPRQIIAENSEDNAPWRKPPVRPVKTEQNSPVKITGSFRDTKTSEKNENEVTLRRTNSYLSDEEFRTRYMALHARIQAYKDSDVIPYRRPPSAQLNNATATLPSPRPRSDIIPNRPPAYFSSSKDEKNESSTPSSNTPSTPSKISSPAQSPQPNSQQPPFRRSFVPPVRDEESETQRKAHAKRVRETRRSTQGVTLEEIKSAEQFVKMKNQPNSNNNESPGANSGGGADDPPGTPTVTVSATITTAAPTVVAREATPVEEPPSSAQERRPSWRLKVDGGSKFKLEDASKPPEQADAPNTPSFTRRSSGTNTPRPASAPATTDTAEATVTLPLRRPRSQEDKEQDKENDAKSAQATLATQAAIQRRRRPKRRSTGVVSFDNMDDLDPEKDPSAGGDNASDTSKLNSQESGTDRSSRSRVGSTADIRNENGEIDYKKLYEQQLVENDRLKDKLRKSDEELRDTKQTLEKLTVVTSKNSLSELEKRERRAMERKLSEMEEELKNLENLKSENQRLKDENGALIRVISKLSK